MSGDRSCAFWNGWLPNGGAELWCEASETCEQQRVGLPEVHIELHVPPLQRVRAQAAAAASAAPAGDAPASALGLTVTLEVHGCRVFVRGLQPYVPVACQRQRQGRGRRRRLAGAQEQSVCRAARSKSLRHTEARFRRGWCDEFRCTSPSATRLHYCPAECCRVRRRWAATLPLLNNGTRPGSRATSVRPRWTSVAARTR